MSQQITLTKDTRQLVIRTVRTNGDGGGGVLAISVVDIDDPSSELNLIAGTLKGDLRLCYQEKSTGDDWTLYAWDDADSGVESVPYTVDGLTGRWNSIAGRNHYNGVRGRDEFTAFGGSVKEISLGITTLASASTGVVRADGLAIGTPTSDLDVGAGFGHIVDIHTDPSNPVFTEISWPAQTVTITDLTDFTITWIFVDSAGVVQQQSTEPTPIELRENVHLGFVGIVGGGIINFVDDPYIATGAAVQLSTLMDAIGSINISVSVSNGGVDLSLAISGGKMHIRGSGFDDTSAGRGDPNTANFADVNPQTIGYLTQSISIIPFVTLIDPLNFDDGGAVTAIVGSSNRATNQRIWMFPDGTMGVQYGTVVYSTLINAIGGSATEAFIDNPVLANANAILLATLSVTKGATNLSDTDEARFLPGGKFGEASIGGSGQSVTSLQQAYNNGMDGTIITDATRTAVKLQRGTALDTDDVLEVLNGAGAQTFSVDGAGAVTPSAVGLGGHVVSDVLISSDLLSTDDTSFVTPGYIDALYASLDDLAVVAATVITDHGGLTGLLDDDHTQYLLVDGTRAMSGALNINAAGFALGGHSITDVLISSDGASVSDAALITAGWATANIVPITDHGALSGLGDDDHTQYLLVDGSRAMTGILAGVGASHARTTGDATTVLAINKSPVSSFAGDGIAITMGGNATGRAINIVNSGSGAAISWNAGQSLAPIGTESLPSQAFIGKLSTGSLSPTGNIYAISTGGTEAVRWTGSQNQINEGDITTGLTQKTIFDDDGDTYLTCSSDDTLDTYVGGSQVLRIIASAVTSLKNFNTQIDAVGAGESLGYRIGNFTAATNVLNQNSPLLDLHGAGWRTDATAESQTVQMALQLEPQTGAANPTGDLVFKSNINAAGYTDVFKISSNGDAVVTPATTDAHLRFGTFASTHYLRVLTTGFSVNVTDGEWHKLGRGFHLVNTAIDSAAAPAIRLGGADSGLHKPATNELAVATGGTTAAIWDASQNMLCSGDVEILTNNKLVLDDDGDTYIQTQGDDLLVFVVAGVLELSVSAGSVNIENTLNHDGTLAGLYGATPVAQSAAYTLNATAVPDRTLLASTSATTTNNNNVIAALITDLQALGALG